MFRDFMSIGFNANSYEEIEEIVKVVDFIEVANGHALYDKNITALWWADEYNNFKTKGSDSHCFDDIGKFYTVFDKEIKTEVDLT